MLKRLQSIDDLILEKIAVLHNPVLNKIMIVISSLGNFGLIWFAICLPFLIVEPWRRTGVNMILGLCIAHLMGEILLKHIVDSATVCSFIDSGLRLIDVGCGAGFPSIPLAILREDIQVTALDSTGKKIDFVSSVAEKSNRTSDAIKSVFKSKNN